MNAATCLGFFGLALLACASCSTSDPPAGDALPADDAAVIEDGPEPGDDGPDASEDSPVEAEPPDASQGDGETSDAKQRVCAEHHLVGGYNSDHTFVPPSCFQMGSPEGEYGRDPVGEAQVETWLDHGFGIQIQEVTRADWQAQGLALPVVEPAEGEPEVCTDPQCPVTAVTWFEALFYANKASGNNPCYELADCVGEPGTGMTCGSVTLTRASVFECTGPRLPTSAEWEHAARGWTETAYYTGDITPPEGGVGCTAQAALEPAGWYCANAGAPPITHAIKTKDFSPFWLYDILGNAAEWVSDDYVAGGYGPGPVSDPGGQVSASGPGQVRGGHAASHATECRAAARQQLPKSARHSGVGLRLAWTITPIFQ